MTSHEDIARQVAKGEARQVAIEKKLDEVLEAVRPIPQMQADIAQTKEIVEAWGAIKNVARFVKWSSGLGGAVAVIWAAIKVAMLGGVR